MACMKHAKQLGKLLTDKGSCPWCYIAQLEEQLKECAKEQKEMERELRGEINGLERELCRAEQEIMDGS